VIGDWQWNLALGCEFSCAWWIIRVLRAKLVAKKLSCMIRMITLVINPNYWWECTRDRFEIIYAAYKVRLGWSHKLASRAGAARGKWYHRYYEEIDSRHWPQASISKAGDIIEAVACVITLQLLFCTHAVLSSVCDSQLGLESRRVAVAERFR